MRNKKKPVFRINKLLSTVAPCVLLLGASPAIGQSLQDTLVQAYETNKQLQAARAGLRATDEGLAQAKAYWFRPQINLTVDHGREHINVKEKIDANTGFSRDRRKLNETVNETILQLDVPLYRGGQTVAGIDEARSSIRSGQAGLVSTEQSVLSSAVTAYANVVYYRTLQDIQQTIVESYEERVQQTQTQVEAERRTVGELALFRNGLAEAKGDLATTLGELAAAESSFKTVVGVEPTSLEDIPTLGPLPTSLEDAMSIATVENPDLLGAKHDIDTQEATIRAAKGELLPQLSFVSYVENDNTELKYNGKSSVYKENENDTTFYVGVELTMALYEGGGFRSAVREAKDRTSQAMLTHAFTLDNLRGSVEASWSRLIASRDTISAAMDGLQAIIDAEEATEFQYERGSATANDLIDILDRRAAAEENLALTYRNRLVAEANLMSDIGRLNVASMELPAAIYDPSTHARDVEDKLFGFD